MSISVIPIILAIGYLFVRYPYALAVIALFLPMESPGVGAAVSGSFKVLVPLLYAGYFLAVFKMLYILWIRRNASLVSRRILTIALLAAGTIGWIAFSMFAGDASKTEAIRVSLSAAPGVLFALVYYNNRSARILLVAAIAVHLLIGCGIIAFPHSPLALLRQSVSSADSLPDVWAMETTVYKDNAQFESAAFLAFYAAVGLIVGMSFLLYKRSIVLRIFGVSLALLGIAATFFTVERGVWIGILIGILVLITPLRQRPIGKFVYTSIFLALAFGVIAICTSSDNFILVALREHFLMAASDSYRVPVALRAVDILIANPLYGVSGDVLKLIDTIGGAPHQSFYFYAVAYGIPAGLFTAIITWFSISTNLMKRRPLRRSGLGDYDQLLARSLSWVVFATAMTNGMSGGMLIWTFLGFTCLPWAFSASREQGPGNREQAAHCSPLIAHRYSGRRQVA